MAFDTKKLALSSSILLLALLLKVPAIKSQQCLPKGRVKLPIGFNPEPANKFPFVEAGLQIFTDISIPCDGGFINQWRFIASGNYVVGLHLGVFRRRRENPLFVDLVGQTYIDQLRVPGEYVGQWVKYTTYSPIPVKAGDIVGIFYDRVTTPTELLTILNKNCEFDTDKRNTYVFLQDQKRLSSSNKTGEISLDLGDGLYDCRKPALMAVLVGSAGVATKPTTTSTTMSTTTSLALMTTTTAAGQVRIRPTKTPRQAPTRRVIWWTPVTTPLPPTTTAPPFAMSTGNLRQLEANNGPLNVFWTSATLPSIVFDTDMTESRCFHVPSMLRFCFREMVRTYFDYRTGTCSFFYGCEPGRDEANNFGSLNDCIFACEKHSQRYHDLFVGTGKKQDLTGSISMMTTIMPTRTKPLIVSGPFEAGLFNSNLLSPSNNNNNNNNNNNINNYADLKQIVNGGPSSLFSSGGGGGGPSVWTNSFLSNIERQTTYRRPGLWSYIARRIK